MKFHSKLTSEARIHVIVNGLCLLVLQDTMEIMT